MISHNNPLKTNLSWLGVLSASLLVSLSTIAFAGGPPPQGKPAAAPATTEPASQEPAKAQPATTQPNATPAAPQATPQTPAQTMAAPARFPLPSARVEPSEGVVTIKLVNTTNALISYQVVGDTQPRTLGEQSEIQLKGLKTPVTITYQREDGGLLMVRPQATATPGFLQVSFSATTDLSVDTKSLNVQAEGGVFLN
ncbi:MULTISPECIES: hypothetical protein [Kamptonema]|uniref:hypothetical protein n=1 Tax=Kamptonema TaxID=1501433 RepID=UPI0001DACCB3|nr:MULTISPECIES: hypothetical protein [Kamptonema]CBN58116.1 conserved exported hypothetical protein [Kamptonema sp. PCC 6506]